MKKYSFVLCLILVFTALNLSAQKPIKIIEDSVQIGNYLYPGFSVTIPEVNFDKTLKNWIKEQETGTKSKVQTENSEMSIFGAIKKEISPNPINIYSQLKNEDTLSRLMVCIELKKDQFVGPYVGDIQLTSVKNFLKEFAKSQYIDFIKQELDAEEKILRDLNQQLNSLESNKARSQKTAKNKRTTVNDEQERLQVKNNELSVLSTEIINKNNEMMEMPVGAGREAMSSQIKELEKRRKQVQKEISKAENKISKAKSDIDQADRSIPKNEDEQAIMKAKIDAQQGVVRKYVDKINTVKLY
jgi:septal ring factor EnvC (AmiA/AmiB activator)